MPTPASERIRNELLINERERRGWTRVNLATRLELPSGDREVRRWEEGETDVQPKNREKLAALLKPETFKKDQKLAYRQLGFVDKEEIPIWRVDSHEICNEIPSGNKRVNKGVNGIYLEILVNRLFF